MCLCPRTLARHLGVQKFERIRNNGILHSFCLKLICLGHFLHTYRTYTLKKLKYWTIFKQFQTFCHIIFTFEQYGVNMKILEKILVIVHEFNCDFIHNTYWTIQHIESKIQCITDLSLVEPTNGISKSEYSYFSSLLLCIDINTRLY